MRIQSLLILILLVSLGPALMAQEQPVPPATTGDVAVAPETAVAEESETTASGRSNYELRNTFSSLLRDHPREVATVLVLEPRLLSNEEFLAAYPAVASFLARHPEIQGNPHFYLGEFAARRNPSGAFDEFLEGITIFAVFALIAFVLSWLVRTIIDQKRWSRLSRVQTEVHTKILDRFGTSGELLEYIKSPAGTKFLESAPIPLHVERPAQNPSLSRVIWSTQIGLVLAAGALGMVLVSGRFEDETAQGLFAIGAIGFSVGAGFVISALVSLAMSRRLGLWQSDNQDRRELDEPEVVR